jgi:hypothetical protein
MIDILLEVMAHVPTGCLLACMLTCKLASSRGGRELLRRRRTVVFVRNIRNTTRLLSLLRKDPQLTKEPPSVVLILDSFMPLSRRSIGHYLSQFVTKLSSASMVVDDIILTESFTRLQCLTFDRLPSESRSCYAHGTDDFAESLLRWHDRRKVLGFGEHIDAKWACRAARGEVARHRITIMSL